MLGLCKKLTFILNILSNRESLRSPLFTAKRSFCDLDFIDSIDFSLHNLDFRIYP